MQNQIVYHSIPRDRASAPLEREPATLKPLHLQIVRGIGTLNLILRHWWAELLAAVLLIIDFSVLIAVLRAYQGKPLPKWPLGLSFNTALSVLIVVFRAPILFVAAEGIGQLKWQWLSTRRPLSDLETYDAATRGPWGSTKLLWAVRWRDILALLAALLTVASLGTDSFTQAVVSYYPCTTSATLALPSISHINSFFSDGTFGYILPTRVSRAVDTSFDNPRSHLPDYSCPVASCIFAQPYHSIGLCSKCSNATDEIHTECTADQSSCNYTLIQDQASSEYHATGNTTAGYTSDIYVSENITYQDWNVLSVRKYTVEESKISHYSSVLDIVSASPLFGCRCQMFYCVRSYTATIDHGVLNETLQSVSDNWSSFTNQTRVINTVRIDCLESRVQQYLLNKGHISVDTEWMSWNGTYLNGTEAQNGISHSSNLTLPVRCVYQLYFDWSVNKGTDESEIRWTPYETFTSVLDNTTLSTSSVTGPAGKGPMTIRNPSMGNLVGLYDNGHLSIESLSLAFENFTTVVSNYMRSLKSSGIHGGVGTTVAIPQMLNLSSYAYEKGMPLPPIISLNPVSAGTENWNQPILGQAFVDTTCIHVRWPWLALPAALFVGTLVFLLILIIKTRLNHELEVWKSSQNALIWHGLDGAAKFESDTLVTKKDMDARAKEVYIRLTKTRKSWKLVQDEY